MTLKDAKECRNREVQLEIDTRIKSAIQLRLISNVGEGENRSGTAAVRVQLLYSADETVDY